MINVIKLHHKPKMSEKNTVTNSKNPNFLHKKSLKNLSKLSRNSPQGQIKTDLNHRSLSSAIEKFGKREKIVKKAACNFNKSRVILINLREINVKKRKGRAKDINLSFNSNKTSANSSINTSRFSSNTKKNVNLSETKKGKNFRNLPRIQIDLNDESKLSVQNARNFYHKLSKLIANKEDIKLLTKDYVRGLGKVKNYIENIIK